MHAWKYGNPFDRSCSLCHEQQQVFSNGFRTWWEVVSEAERECPGTFATVYLPVMRMFAIRAFCIAAGVSLAVKGLLEDVSLGIVLGFVVFLVAFAPSE